MALDETFITALEYGLPLATNRWLEVPQALTFILLYGKHEVLPFLARKPHNELLIKEIRSGRMKQTGTLSRSLSGLPLMMSTNHLLLRPINNFVLHKRRPYRRATDNLLVLQRIQNIFFNRHLRSKGFISDKTWDGQEHDAMFGSFSSIPQTATATATEPV
ncbi:hypothetical protein Tco_1334898 [Tanacetum coccineum]